MTRVASPLLASVALVFAFAWFLHFGMGITWTALAQSPVLTAHYWKGIAQ